MSKSLLLLDKYSSTQIKNTINKVLKSSELGYQTKKVTSGSNFIVRQSWEHPDKFKSILNYVNTNKLYHKWLIEEFKITSLPEMIDLIENKKFDLFKEGGKYFNEMIVRLYATEAVGSKNEIEALNFLKRYWSEYNFDGERTISDSYADMILGVDIYGTFRNHSKQYTFQVKPLFSFSELKDSFVVGTMGVAKEYDVDFYIFINTRSYSSTHDHNRKIKTPKILIFNNNDRKTSTNGLNVKRKVNISGNFYYFEGDSNIGGLMDLY